MLPKILIFHTLRWPNAARLAIAFRQVGCRVDGLCLPDYPLDKLAAVGRAYVYRPLVPLHSIRAAFESAIPDLIIPCDEGAVAQLLRSHRQPGSAAGAQRLRAVIERSLGGIEGYERIATRSNLPAIAAEAGVRTPQTRLVATIVELREALIEMGFPAVLKADYSWSGDGVHIVHDLHEAERAFGRMTGSRPRLSAVKRLLRDRDLELLLQRFRAQQPALTLQRFIAGREANAAIACWQGEIVASLCAEVVVARSSSRNASVLRIVDNPEMLETARLVVRLAGVTGFCGLDFIVEAGSDLPLLIEINPRATQINHLALGPGRDLVAALCARAAGEPVPDRPAITECDTIALFPHEWHRDPQSPHLRSAYHDVPWEEPEFVRINADAPRAP
ncbi:MAG TPA: ATP-grasp domain-containing protein [Stellaceae bacterium]|nr:ATP-grasp domain-containing protein [Stellaceae bacterium]